MMIRRVMSALSSGLVRPNASVQPQARYYPRRDVDPKPVAFQKNRRTAARMSPAALPFGRAGM
jgi:hypothetical protein